MAWASILGDAIGLVMDLQKQVKDLQDELEDMPPDNDVTKREDKETNPEGLKPGLDLGDSPEVSMMVASNTKIAASKRSMHGNDDNRQQMEPQVEVRQLDANEFYLKSVLRAQARRVCKVVGGHELSRTGGYQCQRYDIPKPWRFSDDAALRRRSLPHAASRCFLRRPPLSA